MTSSTTPGDDDSPASALGSTALALGAFSAVGTWFFLIPWTVLAGALAVTFGVMGLHHARTGTGTGTGTSPGTGAGKATGRMWPAIAGTALGAAGVLGTAVLLWAMA
ncbi:hypothetical protein ACH4C6_04555 [Streptomyces sp. NPDC017943]|uniref:hypothetical protein n=1 Tax=Streptomyces sp. NPDC017943 TaxID=3365019 RepID=UPI00378DAB27